MSSTCPHCQNQLGELDFGVSTCPNCQAVLFVNMDGHITATDPGAAAEAVEISATQETQEIGEAQNISEAWMQDQEPALEEVSEPISEVIPEPEPELQASEESQMGEVLTLTRPMTEVSDFANSDQSHGPLSYSVMIENIDTKEIKTQVLEALSDPKFGWDPKDIIRQMKMGALKLENLNPVKASVLVHQLQGVPVKISWEQNVYS
jgi:hypothetical protein